ncbi:MAG: metal-sensing transcriptional repressor [Armatimonadetes bacterium]|nr:metal-sensing transcriptional repressor [Armatimonadota bacterium]
MSQQMVTASTRHGSEEVRAKTAGRLRSIEGHVRGVQRMVEEGLLLEDHLKHCATTAIRAADPTDRERTIRELLEVFETTAKL